MYLISHSDVMPKTLLESFHSDSEGPFDIKVFAAKESIHALDRIGEIIEVGDLEHVLCGFLALNRLSRRLLGCLLG